MGFLSFLLFSYSTSPPPILSSACTRSTKAKPTLMLAKPISSPTSPIYQSYAADETLLSNPASTIPDPYPFKPISLFFSSLTQPHLWDHTIKITPQHRRDRAAKIVAHDRSLSFSTYLSLSLNFWSLSIPPSLSLTELFEFNEWCYFDFCFFKFIYWNFLL